MFCFINIYFCKFVMHSVRRGYCYVIHLRPMCEPSVSSVPSLVSASPARAQSCRNHPHVDTQTYLVQIHRHIYYLVQIPTIRYIWCYEGWQLFNLHISTVYLVLSRVDTLTHLYTILLSRVVRSHRITITNLRVTIQLYLCVNNIDIPGYLCIPHQNV